MCDEKMSKQKEVVKKEVHRCDQCKWYDLSTQRDFHRDGIRKGLVEVRAICRSPTSKARNHLVKNDSERECFEEGKYVPPKKEPKEQEKLEKKRPKKKEMTVSQNDNTATFKKKGRKTVLVKNQ